MPDTHAARLYLNKGVRHRILKGHPWVFSSEVGKIEGEVEDGETVEIRSFRGEFLGSALINRRSQIVARRYSLKNEALDETLIRARLLRAIAYRAELANHHNVGSTREKGNVQPQAQRLVWSESDELPGLIVDRYNDTVVLQTLTLAMGRREKMIAKLLSELLPCTAVLARNDAAVRQIEGLPMEQQTLFGNYSGKTEVSVGGIVYQLDLRNGQKTGFYLDQAHNYQAVARYAADRPVLDCFTNQGAFALAAMRAGAKSCQAIDQSVPALEVARATAERAGISVDWRPGNVFDLLPLYSRQNQTFGLVILDPPSFTKSKDNKESALRGYHELHLQALKLIDKGGILATFSCSHHVTAEDWMELLEQAAADSRCTLRLRERLFASPDHPVLVNVPETEYLRGYILEKV